VRIAHVTATFPPYLGGTGTVCYHNALGLARLGHDVTIFTAALALGDWVDPPQITVRRLPALFRIGNAPLLLGLLRLSEFDIIHLHHPFIFGADMIGFVSRAKGIPYVLTHHNDLIGDGQRRYLFDAYTAISAPWVFRGAAKFAVVSLDHAAHCRLAARFQRRWQDVVEVPNGVDIELFRPGLDGRPVRQRHAIPEDAGVILFVGMLDRAHHYRRVDVLMEAARRLEKEEVHVVLVGSGDRMAFYRELAGRLGLGSRCHFLGCVPHHLLPEVYAAADLVVLPAHLQESFGLVLLEAMACGRPVVASDLPGVRSLVSDREDGLLVRPGDAQDLADKIGALVEDQARRRTMGERGRAKAEELYAWPVILPRLVQVYEQALAAG